jgi:hypothetical protein
MSQDLPLYYQFSVMNGGAETRLTSRGQIAPSLPDQYFGLGTQMLVVGTISDSLGASTTSWQDIRGVNVTVNTTAVAVANAVDFVSTRMATFLDDSLKQAKFSDAVNNVAGFASVLQQASDPCSNVDCSGHGTCALGRCSCSPGYSNNTMLGSTRSGGRSVGCDVAPDPVNGRYSEWSTGTCSLSCGGGVLVRTRTYFPARFGGIDFNETLVDVIPCNTAPCPPEIVNGNYSEWSEWSTCSNKCPGDKQGFFIGNRTRSRRCDNPAPTKGGLDCARFGPNTEAGS